MKKRLAIITFLLVIFGLLYWFSTHSIIEVNVENSASDSTLSYSLRDQSNKDPATVVSSSTKIKKIVAKGDYEVLVRQEGRSYFAIVKTKRFLGSTTVIAKLGVEKSRKFVGNNPAGCMNYAEEILMSYPCNDYYSAITTHVPANNSLPTYTKDNLLTDLSGRIEGVARTSSGSLMLVQTESRGEGQHGGEHILFPLKGNLAVVNPITLSDLKTGDPYSMHADSGGFVVYNSSFTHALRYSSPDAKPANINLEKPKEQNMRPVSIDFRTNSVAMLFTNKSSAKDGDAKSEIITKVGQESKHTTLDGHYSSILFCGSSKICLVRDRTLDVYDTSSENLVQLYKVVDVDYVGDGGHGTLVVNSVGVLEFDVDSRSGSYSYTFGDYRFSSLQLADTGSYVVTIIDKKNRRAALLVDNKSENSDSIDKKVSDLQKIPEVKFVSTYGSFIYVAADIGEPIYNSLTKKREYSPVTKKTVAEKINKEIDKLGIDRKVYTISSNAF